MNTRETGISAEKIAAEHIRNSGLEVLGTNIKTRIGEIDILASDGETLVIVEVRAKKETSHGEPIEAVHFHKQKQVLRVAKSFLASKGMLDSDVRIDVIGVTLSDPPKIDWIKNAILDE